MNKNDSRLRRARQTRLKIAELNVARLAVHSTNLRVDVQVGTVHSQASDVQFRNLQAGLTCTAQTRVIFVHDVHPYFFLVSFRITRSSA